MDGLISIGQLSADMGISIRTIRYYEELGIIKPARTTDANYRYYGTAEREKLGIIIVLKKIGFSLQHIKTVLADYQRSTMLQIIDELDKKMKLEMAQLVEKKEILRSLSEGMRDHPYAAPLQVVSDTIFNKKEHTPIMLKDDLSVKVLGIGRGSAVALSRLAENGAKPDLIHIERAGGLESSAAYEQMALSQETVEEEWLQISHAMRGSDMLFLLVSMEDDWVCSTASIIAKKARQMGILTISIATDAQGAYAAEGVERMRHSADMLLELPLTPAEDEMYNAVQCVLSFVRSTFILDMEDLKSMIRSKGYARFGISSASGHNRALEAAEYLLNSDRLAEAIRRSDSIMLNIAGSNDIQLSEVHLIADHIASIIHPDANMMFATVVDEDMQDSLLLTIVAAGTVESME